MTSKEILLNDKTTASWWNGVVKNPSFQTIVLLARSHFIGKETEMQKGAIEMLEWLEKVAESPNTQKKTRGPQLRHDFNEPKK